MNLKKGKLVRGIFAALSVLLAFCMLTTGCGSEGVPIFEKKTPYQSHIQLAVKSEMDIFDINSVTFELYYGFWDISYCEKYGENPKWSYIFADMGDDVFFGLYICDSKSYNDIHNDLLVTDYKTIEGHFYMKSISDEEAFTEEYGYQSGKKCNHSEKITIPKEFFSKEKEYLVIKIIGFQEPLTEGGEYYTNRNGYIDLEYRKIDENTVQIDFSPYRDLY